MTRQDALKATLSTVMFMAFVLAFITLISGCASTVRKVQKNCHPVNGPIKAEFVCEDP